MQAYKFTQSPEELIEEAAEPQRCMKDDSIERQGLHLFGPKRTRVLEVVPEDGHNFVLSKAITGVIQIDKSDQ